MKTVISLKTVGLAAVFAAWIPVTTFASDPPASQVGGYIPMVRQFADNVLKHGRDVYGPEHSQIGRAHV